MERDEATHVLLTEIADSLMTIKKIAVFFTVLWVIGLAGVVLAYLGSS